MKRPFGVTLVAILALINGLFGLCWPILAFTGSVLLGGIFGTLGLVAGIVLIIGPLLQLIFAFGAFGLRSWAWYLGLIATGVTVLSVVVSLFEGSSFFPATCGSIIPIIIFIYLLTPNVRKVFGIGSAGAAPVPQPDQVEPVPPAPAPVEPVAPAPVEPESPEPPGSSEGTGG
jgi:hypothetical protein